MRPNKNMHLLSVLSCSGDGKQLQLIGVALIEVSSTSLDVTSCSGAAWDGRVSGPVFTPKWSQNGPKSI